MKVLFGPFREMLPLRALPQRGPLKDEQLEILPNAGLVVEAGRIVALGNFEALRKQYRDQELQVEEQQAALVLLPGFVDAHTHLCWAGSRARDYAARNNGKSYQEIAKAGGGIWDTVQQTRNASEAELVNLTTQRLDRHLRSGITTVEIKSGYGLSVNDELKILRAIQQAAAAHSADVVPTCLAAHIVPKDYKDANTYLRDILDELVPQVQAEQLARRFDIFVEEGAFDPKTATPYLQKLRGLGFQLTVHGDQFSTGGSAVAVNCGALSVDHLEVSGEKEIQLLAGSDTVPVALPGASIGLGCAFTPARRLLDAGCALAIASDWNPGSAPQGNLLMQAAVLGAYEKLSAAEVFAGLTFRAARALGLSHTGHLAKAAKADFIAFATDDYREILYQQGSLMPRHVWKNGKQII
ncbi:MAG: imidazolonepropionase [Bacteroidota bacterium]